MITDLFGYVLMNKHDVTKFDDQGDVLFEGGMTLLLWGFYLRTRLWRAIRNTPNVAVVAV